MYRILIPLFITGCAAPPTIELAPEQPPPVIEEVIEETLRYVYDGTTLKRVDTVEKPMPHLPKPSIPKPPKSSIPKPPKVEKVEKVEKLELPKLRVDKPEPACAVNSVNAARFTRLENCAWSTNIAVTLKVRANQPQKGFDLTCKIVDARARMLSVTTTHVSKELSVGQELSVPIVVNRPANAVHIECAN